MKSARLLPLLAAATLASIGSVAVEAASPAWTNVGPKVPAIEGPVAADPASGRIYIGTFGGGVLKSTDGGATWAKSDAGIPPTTEIGRAPGRERA